jgi:hypothetical protein
LGGEWSGRIAGSARAAAEGGLLTHWDNGEGGGDKARKGRKCVVSGGAGRPIDKGETREEARTGEE